MAKKSNIHVSEEEQMLKTISFVNVKLKYQLKLDIQRA